MFPNCQYEDFDSRFWHPGYKLAFDWERKALTLRADSCKYKGYAYDSKRIKTVLCELCQVVCFDPEEFLAHCI